MADDSVIRSRAHPLIKRVGAIRAGREPGMLVLEGDRLIDDAIGAGLELETVLVAASRADRIAELVRKQQSVRAAADDLVQSVSALTTSPGILALCAAPLSVSLAELELDERALVLVVAGVADPGNLGAIARCAEAFGVRALVVARGGASPWNEKALRGSMGSLLRIPVCHGESADEIARVLEDRGVRQCAAATREGIDPVELDWSGPRALWISGETGALPAAARSFETLTIPMTGRAESLNVTVAAAVLLYARSMRIDRASASTNASKSKTAGRSSASGHASKGNTGNRSKPASADGIDRTEVTGDERGQRSSRRK
jgi:TrmH family RNA methyltransferase